MNERIDAAIISEQGHRKGKRCALDWAWLHSAAPNETIQSCRFTIKNRWVPLTHHWESAVYCIQLSVKKRISIEGKQMESGLE